MLLASVVLSVWPIASWIFKMFNDSLQSYQGSSSEYILSKSMCHWSTLRLIYTWWVTLLMCRMGRLMTEWLRCLCQHLLWITDCLFHVKEQRIPFILATQHYFVGVEWRQGNRRLITVTCQMVRLLLMEPLANSYKQTSLLHCAIDTGYIKSKQLQD